MNHLLEAAKAAMRLLARLLPETWQSLANLVIGLLDMLDLAPGDPRTERVAELIADLMNDMDAAMDLPDATAQEKARLVLENRFMRAWFELSPGGGR